MLAGPWLIAALVLFASGLAKLRRPQGATRALRTLGLPPAARSLGAAEVVLALACVAAPGRATAVALTAAYAVFAIAAVALRRRAPQAGCGCFGETATPVGRVHVAANLAAAATGAVAIAAPPPLPHLAALPLATFVVAVLGAAWAAVLVYTELPGGTA